jgi:hypothetical protein
MKTPLITSMAIGAAMLCAAEGWTAGEPPPAQPQAQYSADSYTETEDLTLREKVYVAGQKQRKEQDMSGSTQVSIIRGDKGVVWMLMPDEKMYMEMGMQQAQAQDPSADLAAYQMERTEVGPDTVNGIPTTKYKIIMTGADGTKLGGFQWVTNTGIQVKLDALSKEGKSTERIKLELTNLNIANQDPALFEIPKGYTKMTMPSFPGMGDMKSLIPGGRGFGGSDD